MTDQRSGGRYRKAVANLKAQAEVQYCWRCGKELYAIAPKGHPQSITLGHLIALEDGGDLLDPSNHAPECPKCNYGDGARRTNSKRRSKTERRHSYRSERW